MSRIIGTFEPQIAWRMKLLGSRRPELAAWRIVANARKRAISSRRPVALVLADLYQAISDHPRLRLQRPHDLPDRFFCDSGLGGLARWLRAAGYEAKWEPAIDDSELLKRVQEHPAVLLTTDSMLMERRLLRDRVIPAFWLPPIHPLRRQFQIVMAEFGLGLRAPRCMKCGGALREVSKEAARDRIPPRTYRWIDQYFECERCGQLFWHGTHWLRIRRELESARALAGLPSA